MCFVWVCLTVLLISKWITAGSQGLPSLSPRFLHCCSCSANVRLNHEFHHKGNAQWIQCGSHTAAGRTGQKKHSSSSSSRRSSRSLSVRGPAGRSGRNSAEQRAREASLCRVHTPPVYPRLTLVYQGKALKFITALSLWRSFLSCLVLFFEGYKVILFQGTAHGY